jgi:hypothetical protein
MWVLLLSIADCQPFRLLPALPPKKIGRKFE